MTKWLFDGSYLFGTLVINLMRSNVLSMALDTLPPWLKESRSPYASMLKLMHGGGGWGGVDDVDGCFVVPNQSHRHSDLAKDACTGACCHGLSTWCCLWQSSPDWAFA